MVKRTDKCQMFVPKSHGRDTSRSLTVVYPETCSNRTLLGPLWPNFSVDFTFLSQFPILSWTPRVTRHRCKYWFLINLACLAFSDLQLRHDSCKHLCQLREAYLPVCISMGRKRTHRDWKFFFFDRDCTARGVAESRSRWDVYCRVFWKEKQDKDGKSPRWMSWYQLMTGNETWVEPAGHRTHTVEWKERMDLHKWSSDLHTYPGTHRCPSPVNKYMHEKWNTKRSEKKKKTHSKVNSLKPRRQILKLSEN